MFFGKVLIHRLVVALLIGASAFYGARQAAADPAVEDAENTGLAIELSQDHIQWGEEIDVSVSATNSTGTTVSGGIYVSFDEDVLMLDVIGGAVLRAGDSAFNFADSASKPIARPMVESWEDTWKPSVQRKVVLKVMPLAREHVRVLARASFVGSGRPKKLFISPTSFESRSLDQTGFPSTVSYLYISQKTGLRRSFRRFEHRLRQLDNSDQIRFANALASMLEDQNSLKSLLNDETASDIKQSLLFAAPQIASKLRRDPPVALENLRCLLVDLNCSRGAVYFGVPLAVYQEKSPDEVARLNAKTSIANEKGGNELVALLEAEGMSYRQDKPGSAVVVKLNGTGVVVEDNRAVVKELLNKLIPLLGPAAEKSHPEINGLSFVLLQGQLNAGSKK
jgi:hypothetical protein